MLLPLLCGYSMILLPLGVADALPRANRFWAVSPRVRRNKYCSYNKELLSSMLVFCSTSTYLVCAAMDFSLHIYIFSN